MSCIAASSPGGFAQHLTLTLLIWLGRLWGLTALTELFVVMPQKHRLVWQEFEEWFWASLLAPNLEVLRVVGFGPRYWSEQSLRSAIDKTCKKMRKVRVDGNCFLEDAAELQNRKHKTGYDFRCEAVWDP